MKSIRTKILAGSSLITAFFVLLLGVVSAVLNYTSTFGEVENNMSRLSTITAQRVEWEIHNYVSIAESFGGRSELADPWVPVEQKESLLSAWATQYGFIRANLLDSSGISQFDGQNYSDRDYFQQCMQGNSYVSTPVVSKQTGELTIIVAAPLWANGIANTQVVGVVYFVPEETFLNDIMSDIQVSANGGAYMIDKSGNTIADTTMDTIMTQNIENEAADNRELQTLANIHEKMRQGVTGVERYSMNGESKLIAYAPVDGTDGWSVGITAPSSDFMASTYTSIVVIIILVVLSLVIGGLIISMIARKIAKPVRTCADRLKSLSEGDLHSDVPVIKTRDETGVLAEATKDIADCLQSLIRDESYVLGEMAQGNFDITADQSVYRGDLYEIYKSLKGINRTLSLTLMEINETADQVASGAEQVASGAQALSQGATEQASSVEELAATINDINGNIQANTKLAEKSNEVSEEAGRLLGESMEKMNELVAAMDEINSSSNEIGRIIKTIEDIAFQTNILALNAAVEAARAGNAGKGFAVVADEVRSLAEKSAEASKTTSELIEHSIQAVENGTRIAGDTSESIKNTAISAKEAISFNGEIRKNSTAQAEQVAQVTVGVDQISSVVQTNSATAQQSSAASEELAGQAEMLKKAVGRFKLKDRNAFDSTEYGQVANNTGN